MAWLMIFPLPSRSCSPVILNDILQHNEDNVRLTIETPLLLVCYGKPIANNLIQYSFMAFIIKDPLYPMVDLQPQQLTIYPDGSYAGQLEIREYPNSKSIFKLSSKLPVEYANRFE